MRWVTLRRVGLMAFVFSASLGWAVRGPIRGTSNYGNNAGVKDWLLLPHPPADPDDSEPPVPDDRFFETVSIPGLGEVRRQVICPDRSAVALDGTSGQALRQVCGTDNPEDPKNSENKYIFVYQLPEITSATRTFQLVFSNLAGFEGNPESSFGLSWRNDAATNSRGLASTITEEDVVRDLLDTELDTLAVDFQHNAFANTLTVAVADLPVGTRLAIFVEGHQPYCNTSKVFCNQNLPPPLYSLPTLRLGPPSVSSPAAVTVSTPAFLIPCNFGPLIASFKAVVNPPPVVPPGSVTFNIRTERDVIQLASQAVTRELGPAASAKIPVQVQIPDTETRLLVSALYHGTLGFNVDSSQVSLSCIPQGSRQTITSIVGPREIGFRGRGTFSVSVVTPSGPDVTGPVQLLLDDVPYQPPDTHSFVVDPLPVGRHTLTAIFVGSLPDDFAASTQQIEFYQSPRPRLREEE